MKENKKFINATFSCNEYYLLGNILTSSYKINDILAGIYPNLDSISEDERALFLKQFEEFLRIARDMPCIDYLLNFGDNFDKVLDEEKASYNDSIFNELARNG